MLWSLLFAATASRIAPLTKLIDRCDEIALSHGGCGDLDKPVWRTFEGATGELTKVDMNSIEAATGSGAFATIYTFAPGTNLDLNKLRQLYFTCHGQYADTDNISHLHDAPPRSVVGIIARVVCPIGETKRRSILAARAKADRQAHERASHPRPEEYCQGFSTESCAEITAGVEAKIAPSFCKPGFGQVGSGLTPEQLRICYARSPIDP